METLVNGNGRIALVHVMNAYRGNGGICVGSLILNPVIRWSLVVSLTILSLFQTPLPIEWDIVWIQVGILEVPFLS